MACTVSDSPALNAAHTAQPFGRGFAVSVVPAPEAHQPSYAAITLGGVLLTQTRAATVSEAVASAVRAVRMTRADRKRG